jgi:hypothetical protein
MVSPSTFVVVPGVKSPMFGLDARRLAAVRTGLCEPARKHSAVCRRRLVVGGLMPDDVSTIEPAYEEQGADEAEGEV